jgi:hypothetical protein
VRVNLIESALADVTREAVRRLQRARGGARCSIPDGEEKLQKANTQRGKLERNLLGGDLRFRPNSVIGSVR